MSTTRSFCWFAISLQCVLTVMALLGLTTATSSPLGFTERHTKLGGKEFVGLWEYLRGSMHSETPMGLERWQAVREGLLRYKKECDELDWSKPVPINQHCWEIDHMLDEGGVILPSR